MGASSGTSAPAAQDESPKDDANEEETPDVTDLKIETQESPVAETAPSISSTPATKGRVLFMYTCPSGSPIKFRMVYSSNVRGIQQDAADRAGVQIAGKVRYSPILGLTVHLSFVQCLSLSPPISRSCC